MLPSRTRLLHLPEKYQVTNMQKNPRDTFIGGLVIGTIAGFLIALGVYGNIILAIIEK